jgi:hypothetical protein
MPGGVAGAPQSTTGASYVDFCPAHAAAPKVSGLATTLVPLPLPSEGEAQLVIRDQERRASSRYFDHSTLPLHARCELSRYREPLVDGRSPRGQTMRSQDPMDVPLLGAGVHPLLPATRVRAFEDVDQEHPPHQAGRGVSRRFREAARLWTRHHFCPARWEGELNSGRAFPAAACPCHRRQRQRAR